MNVPEPFGEWPGGCVTLEDLIVPSMLEDELERWLSEWFKKNIVRRHPAQHWTKGKWRRREVVASVSQERLTSMLPHSSNPSYDISAHVSIAVSWRIRRQIGKRARPSSVLLERPRVEFHRLALCSHPSMIVNVAYYTI